MYIFRFKGITHADIEKYFVALNSKANNDLLDFDMKLVNCAAPFISKSLAQIINECVHRRVNTDW